MLKKALIFDFDGVIINSVKIKDDAFKQIVKGYPRKVKNLFFKYHRRNLGKSRYIKFEYLLKTLIKKKYKKKDIENLSIRFNKIILNKIIQLKLNSGVIRFLKKNKSIFQYFISSGTPEKELQYIIKKKGIESFFSKIYGSPKEKFEHIREIIKLFNLKKKDIVFVGDGLSDLEAASKMKLNFIQVGNNFKYKNVKYKIKYFHQLEKLINSKNILNIKRIKKTVK